MTSPEWPSRASAIRRVKRSRSEGGGALLFLERLRDPPVRGRWVVATVATTVTPATGPTRGLRSAAGLAHGAEGGAPGIDQDAAQLGAAAQARLPRPPVAGQLLLVA